MLLIIALLSSVSSAQPGAVELRIMAEEAISRRYVDAYFSKQWEVLRDLACDDLVFDDPAGVALFNSPASHDGADAVVAAMRKGLESLELRFVQTTEVTAVGEWRSIGALTWTMPIHGKPLTSTVSMAVELSLDTHEGKPCVGRHRDIVDYRPFLNELKASAKAAASKGG